MTRADWGRELAPSDGALYSTMRKSAQYITSQYARASMSRRPVVEARAFSLPCKQAGGATLARTRRCVDGPARAIRSKRTPLGRLPDLRSLPRPVSVSEWPAAVAR